MTNSLLNNINYNIKYAVDTVKNYANDIPKNIIQSCTISFFARFGVTLLLTTSGLHTALTLGALSATATAIHALISPMFKRIFPQENATEFDFMRTVSSLVIVTYYASYYLNFEQLVSTDKEVYLTTICIANLIFNAFSANAKGYSWDTSKPLFI